MKRRVNALKNLQVKCAHIEAKFYEEVHELERKYAALYQPLFDKVIWICQSCSVRKIQYVVKCWRSSFQLKVCGQSRTQREQQPEEHLTENKVWGVVVYRSSDLSVCLPAESHSCCGIY